MSSTQQSSQDQLEGTPAHATIPPTSSMIKLSAEELQVFDEYAPGINLDAHPTDVNLVLPPPFPLAAMPLPANAEFETYGYVDAGVGGATTVANGYGEFRLEAQDFDHPSQDEGRRLAGPVNVQPQRWSGGMPTSFGLRREQPQGSAASFLAGGVPSGLLVEQPAPARRSRSPRVQRPAYRYEWGGTLSLDVAHGVQNHSDAGVSHTPRSNIAPSPTQQSQRQPEPRPRDHDRTFSVSGRLIKANTPEKRRDLYQALHPTILILLQMRNRLGMSGSVTIRLAADYETVFAGLKRDIESLTARLDPAGDNEVVIPERGGTEEGWIDFIGDWDLPHRDFETAEVRQEWLLYHWNDSIRKQEKEQWAPVIVRQGFASLQEAGAFMKNDEWSCGEEIDVGLDGASLVITSMRDFSRAR